MSVTSVQLRQAIQVLGYTSLRENVDEGMVELQTFKQRVADGEPPKRITSHGFPARPADCDTVWLTSKQITHTLWKKARTGRK